MGEYADEMIDRMLDWEGPGYGWGWGERSPRTKKEIAEWHAQQNRKAAEEALDEALADEEENDDD